MSEDAFAHCTSAFGNSMASFVAHGTDDLQTHQIGVLKREVRDLPDGLTGHSTTGRRTSDPVAQVAEPVDAVDLVDTAAPEEATVGTDDGESVLKPLNGKLSPRTNPLGRFRQGVLRVTPG